MFRWIDGWALKKQRDELAAFVVKLQALDSTELSAIVAMATHARHALALQGHDVMEPAVYFSARPELPLTLNRMIRDLQKLGHPQVAVGLMVWLHTARAAIRPELRQLGRDLWRQLARGFEGVEDSALYLRLPNGEALNTDRAAEFPSGFTPEPF